ncbi:MAG TPA: MDR family MFS transporter [Dehalococcoidia bacterium]|nr:MDR family MFS transporter [Dehalococcoidia bacterium]
MTRLRNAPYKWLVAAAFTVGLFMDLMDLTIVNVALPVLGQKLKADSSGLEWVVTGYLLSLAIWIPASGWIGDTFGTKRTFMFALAMFTVSSALCGLSQNIEQLIAFRILQGVGGGMMTPVGTAMLFRAFPPSERARASLVLTIPTVIAPALGPIIGGLLVDDVSWRWIFYVNVPIGVIGFFFCWLFLKEHTEPRSGAFDLWGFVLSGGGLALVLYALSKAPEDGWTSATVLGSGLTGIACFVAMVFVELRRAQPMLDLRLLADRMFRNANIVYFTASASLISVLFLLPLFLQSLRGYSAVETGVILVPQALAVVLFAQLSGRLYPTVGPRRLLIVALTLFAVSSAMFLWVDLGTNVWWIVGIMFIRGIAMAFTFIPLQAATYATITPQDTGRASSLFNTNRQVSSSFGVAILATVLFDRAAHYGLKAFAPQFLRTPLGQHAGLLGFHDAFFAGVILGVIGVAFAFLIRDEDAAATMHRGAGERAATPAVAAGH